jgi:hypothetical protein
LTIAACHGTAASGDAKPAGQLASGAGPARLGKKLTLAGYAKIPFDAALAGSACDH